MRAEITKLIIQGILTDYPDEAIMLMQKIRVNNPKVKDLEKFIKQVVLHYYKKHSNLNIKQADLTSKSRDSKKVVIVRQFQHYFLVGYTYMGLKAIAISTGIKSHATVLHSAKSIKNDIKTDPFKKAIYVDIEKALAINNIEFKRNVKG